MALDKGRIRRGRRLDDGGGFDCLVFG